MESGKTSLLTKGAGWVRGATLCSCSLPSLVPWVLECRGSRLPCGECALLSGYARQKGLQAICGAHVSACETSREAAARPGIRGRSGFYRSKNNPSSPSPAAPQPAPCGWTGLGAGRWAGALPSPLEPSSPRARPGSGSSFKTGGGRVLVRVPVAAEVPTPCGDGLG